MPLTAGPWQGLLGPANLPPAVVTLVHREWNAVLAEPQVREQLLKNGLEVVTGSVQDFRTLLDSEYERWGYKGYGYPYVTKETWTPPFAKHYGDTSSRYFTNAGAILPFLAKV